MNINAEKLARMIDSVAINIKSNFSDIEMLATTAKKYGFFLVIGLQCFNSYLIESLKGSNTIVGGAGGAGFGTECTENKMEMANMCLDSGCKEIDMCINLAYLRSGMEDKALDELKKMRAAIPTVLKVIIEAPELTNEQIKTASEIVALSGADFIKTATGFYGATTVDMVKTIKQSVGDRIQIKAAGGIIGVDMVRELLDLGVTRFGLSYGKAVDLMEKLKN